MLQSINILSFFNSWKYILCLSSTQLGLLTNNHLLFWRWEMKREQGRVVSHRWTRCWWCCCSCWSCNSASWLKLQPFRPSGRPSKKSRSVGVSQTGNLSEAHCAAACPGPPEGPRHPLIKYTSAAVRQVAPLGKGTPDGRHAAGGGREGEFWVETATARAVRTRLTSSDLTASCMKTSENHDHPSKETCWVLQKKCLICFHKGSNKHLQ